MFLHHAIFRLKQGLRIFNLNPRFSIPILIVVGILVMIKLPESSFYPPIFLAIVTLFHFQRKDIVFLKKIFVKHWRLVIYIENALLYSVFIFINIHYQLDILGWLGFAFIGLLSFILPKPKTSPIYHWDIIPNSLFEWKTFLRRHSILSVLAYLALLASAYHPASFILFGLLISDYLFLIFDKNENKEMLTMYFRQTDFSTKIRKNLHFFNGLLFPAYFIFISINANHYPYLLFYIAFFNLYYLQIIIGKYKNYHHKTPTNHYNMGVALQYFFCAITIFPAIFLIITNIKIAKKNIKSYVGN